MEDQITGTVDEKTGQIDAPTLKILGLPNLRKLDTTEEMIDADKIQKARDRTAQKIQEIKAKVDSYLEKAKLDDLSRDPDIVNEQIERAERQMHRIAKFIWNEMIDDDKEDGEKEDSNATYAEKLEHVKDVLNQGIKEGNLLKFQILSIWMIQFSIYDIKTNLDLI